MSLTMFSPLPLAGAEDGVAAAAAVVAVAVTAVLIAVEAMVVVSVAIVVFESVDLVALFSDRICTVCGTKGKAFVPLLWLLV